MCNSFLTHSESGNHVGTRLHMSLMIRITTTAELRLLTLAWRHKQSQLRGGAATFTSPPCFLGFPQNNPEYKASTERSEQLSHLQINNS